MFYNPANNHKTRDRGASSPTCLLSRITIFITNYIPLSTRGRYFPTFYRRYSQFAFDTRSFGLIDCCPRLRTRRHTKRRGARKRSENLISSNQRNRIPRTILRDRAKNSVFRQTPKRKTQLRIVRVGARACRRMRSRPRGRFEEHNK